MKKEKLIKKNINETKDITFKFKSETINSLESSIIVEGKYKILSKYSELLDKRSYFNTDKDGNIRRKKLNLILPFFAFENDPKKLAEYLIFSADPKERNKISEIKRLSNETTEKLEKNLMKNLINGELDFSKRYAKELYFRDFSLFFKTIFTFSLMGNMESLKALAAISFKKIMKEIVYDENIFYLFISFLTKYRDNFNDYENELSEPSGKEFNPTLKCDSLETKAYLNILKSYNYPNKQIFYNILVKNLSKFEADKTDLLRFL